MKQLLTVNQLAEHYNVSRDTIYRWVRNGAPQQLTPSGQKRFDIDDIRRWTDLQWMKGGK